MNLNNILSDGSLLDQIIKIQLEYILSLENAEIREMEMANLVDLLDIRYNA